jgi:hypothetical protein
MCKEAERHSEADAVMHMKERRRGACKRELHRSPDTPENLLQLAEMPPPIWLRGLKNRRKALLKSMALKGLKTCNSSWRRGPPKDGASPAMRSLMRKSLKPPLLFKTFSSAWPSKGKIGRLRADSAEAT